MKRGTVAVRQGQKGHEISQRVFEARTSGELDVMSCTLDPTALRKVVQCLERGNIHTLILARCHWHNREQSHTSQELMTGMLVECLRKKHVAVNLEVLDLSHLSSNQTVVALLSSLLQGQTDYLCSLRELRIRGTGLTGEAAGQVIAAVIRSCPRLRVLDLSNSRKLGSDGVRALAWGLQNQCKQSTLKEVRCAACLDDDDAAVFISAMAQLPCLESIDLTMNLLGLASRALLTSLLKTTTTLRTLKIGYFGNLLATGNAHPFATSLAASSLEKLDLSLYLAHPKSIRHVLTVLPYCQSLQVLAISGAAMPLVAKVLPQFSSLHSLDIRGSFEWNNSVQSAFFENRSLHGCITVNDDFPHKGSLDALVKRNRALTLWQQANQKERAMLTVLWPQILCQSRGDSVVGLSCFLGLLRRGFVEC